MRWFLVMTMLTGCAGPEPIVFFGGGGYGINSSRPELDGITGGGTFSVYGDHLLEFSFGGAYGDYGGPRMASSNMAVFRGLIGEDGHVGFPPLSSCTVFGDRVECMNVYGYVSTYAELTEPIEWELSDTSEPRTAPGVERSHTFEEEPRWD